MNEINESMSRKEKYMTPNLQGKSKLVNKLNAAAYGNSQPKSSSNNAPYFHERNTMGKSRVWIPQYAYVSIYYMSLIILTLCVCV